MLKGKGTYTSILEGWMNGTREIDLWGASGIYRLFRSLDTNLIHVRWHGMTL